MRYMSPRMGDLVSSVPGGEGRGVMARTTLPEAARASNCCFVFLGGGVVAVDGLGDEHEDGGVAAGDSGATGRAVRR